MIVNPFTLVAKNKTNAQLDLQFIEALYIQNITEVLISSKYCELYLT